MKKFLSLVLALVMTMSLVTISAGAKDFTDSSKINYEEAVAVMSAVKVIDGYEDGSFNPQGNLTRGAAAKIICNLILGPTTAAALSADTAPYKDVPVNHTFAGYIAYCQQQGIISGYADGTFRPSATLTNYAFLKMLLGALGYDAQVEGYVGDNWSIQVAKRALAIGLTDGLVTELNGTAAATREEACLYALNTMKTTMVDYDTKTTVTVGGAEVVVAGSTAQEVKWSGTKNADGNIKDDNLVQFAEKYFSDLKLEGGVGIYGRPANTWILKTKEIGTYVSATPDYVYTAETKQDKIYKAVGKTIAAEYDWEAYVDGAALGEVTAPVNKDKAYDVTVDGKTWTLSQDGMTTELYIDEDNKTVTVVCINQYLAEVTRVKEDDDGTYAVLNVSKYAGVLDDDTIYTDEFEEEEYVVVTIDCVDQDADKAYIATAEEPETVTGKVTLVNKEDNNSKAGTYLKFDDGTKYNYSVNTSDDLDDGDLYPDLKGEYKLYLDSNGFVIGFISTEDVTANYLYVENVHMALKMDAEVVFTDATEKTIRIDEKNDVKVTSSDETAIRENVFFYEYNEKKDTYDIETGHGIGDKVADSATMDVGIVNGKAYIVKSVGGTESAACIVGLKTVFVDVEDNQTYVGYKEVPSYKDVTFVPVDHNGDNVADIIFILDGDKYDDEKSFVFLEKLNQDTTHHASDGTKVWLYTKAYGMDGKKFDFYAEISTTATGVITSNGIGLYEIVKSNSTGEYAKEVRFIGGINSSAFQAVNAISAGKKEGSFWLTNNANQSVMYTYDEETNFVVINLENDAGTLKIDSVKPGSGSDLKDGIATAYVDADSKNIAQNVFILKTPAAETKTVTISGNATPTLVSGGSGVSGKVITAYKGADVKFTLTADAGYKITKVTVGGTELVADGSGVYTIEEISSNTTVKVETVAYSAATLNLVFNQDARVTIDGVAYTANSSIELEAGKEHTVTVAYPSSVAADLQALELDGYVQPVYGNTAYITLGAGTTSTLAVGVEMFDLTLLSGISASWTLGSESGSISAGATGEVPDGAAVTLSGNTLKTSTGAAAVTSFTMTADKALASEDYGYVEVTLSPMDGTGATTLTSAQYVKAGEATTIAGDVKTVSGVAWTTARTFTLKDGGTTIGSAASTGDPTTDTLSFSVSGVTLTADTTITVEWN